MKYKKLIDPDIKPNIKSLSSDKDLQALSRIWIREITPHRWTYNFRWLGRPAIQFPNDTWALQEIIWKIKPDLIIETGIAHGGSLIFSASMLALLDICEAIKTKKILKPSESKRKVLGIDIDIRNHNRKAIESHPLSSRIEMIQGSSINKSIIKKVRQYAKNYKKIMVCLDSNHTHDHVLAELKAYAPLVQKGSYCVVYDTIIEDMPKEFFHNRSWGPGNSPKTAVQKFVKKNPNFTIEKTIDYKLLISVAPSGFLRRK